MVVPVLGAQQVRVRTLVVAIVVILRLHLYLFMITYVHQILFLPLAFTLLLHSHFLLDLHRFFQVLLLLLLLDHVLLHLLDSQAHEVAQLLEHFPIQFFQVDLIDSLIVSGLKPSVPVANLNDVFQIALRQSCYFLCKFLFLGGCDGCEIVKIGVLVGVSFGMFADFALVGDLEL